MDYTEIVVELKKISESDPEQYKKIILDFLDELSSEEVKIFFKTLLNDIKIVRSPPKSDKYQYHRFSISKWRSGKRIKYVSLGKITSQHYVNNSKTIDMLCNTGDAEGLISQPYFILKEEKSVIQDKITDFFKE